MVQVVTGIRFLLRMLKLVTGRSAGRWLNLVSVWSGWLGWSGWSVWSVWIRRLGLLDSADWFQRIGANGVDWIGATELTENHILSNCATCTCQPCFDCAFVMFVVLQSETHASLYPQEIQQRKRNMSKSASTCEMDLSSSWAFSFWILYSLARKHVSNYQVKFCSFDLS